MDLWSLILISLLDDQSGDLLERLRTHDPDALADLYDLYGARLYSIILRICRNPSLAEDLVQEAFLKLWNRAGLLDSGHKSVGPWLMMIGRNCAVDVLRAERNRTHVALEGSTFSVPDSEPALLDNERYLRLAGALQALPEDQRQVLELAYFEDLSQTEIAARLDQPLGTIKGRTRLALRKIREELSGLQTVTR